MKIAIPVNENHINTTICMSFGRTPYFLIYDMDSKESLFLDNSAAASQGGAGIKAAQMIVDHNADVLLTPRCGENAASVLNTAEIKLFKTVTNSLEESLKAFEADQLSPLDEIHPGFHNHG